MKDIKFTEQEIQNLENGRISKAELCKLYDISINTLNKKIKLYNIKTKFTSIFGRRNLIGLIFGRLTVIEYNGVDNHSKSKWLCKCNCGNIVSINAASLIRNLSLSCGCYRHDVMHKGYKDISKSYWRRICGNASDRGLEFLITPEYVWTIYEQQNSKCIYTNLDICFYPDNNKPYKCTASIDRIDSKEGYIIGNIQIVHKIVNVMKSSMSDCEFISMCNLIANNKKMNYEDCIKNIPTKPLCKIRHNHKEKS